MDDAVAEISITGPDGETMFEGTQEEFSRAAKSVTAAARLGGSAGQLKTIVARIERLNDEISGLQDDVKDIYKEAKSNGFDVAAIRKVVAERKKDASEREAQMSMFSLYWDVVEG